MISASSFAPAKNSMQKFAASRDVSCALSGARREMTKTCTEIRSYKMSTTAVIKHQTNEPALATYAPDPFEALANAISPRTIVGALLKFSKGDFLAGEDAKEIPEGTAFTANVDELMVGWVKWSNGKPIEHIMVRVAEGRTLPNRAELGDDDATRWETDSLGAPRDPWQYTSYLPLMGETGDLYTFTTSSRGGLGANGDLCRL